MRSSFAMSRSMLHKSRKRSAIVKSRKRNAIVSIRHTFSRAIPFAALDSHPCPQHFGDTPGLSDTSARGERRLRIEYLTDRPHTRSVEMPGESRQRAADAGNI